MEYKGTKKVEIPYFLNQLKTDKSVLIVGECLGNDGISKGIHELGLTDVITTDIRPRQKDCWLDNNTTWEHHRCDFLELNSNNKKYDFIISISVFEHFGMYWDEMSMHGDGGKTDIIRWNHDLKAISKCCNLLKDKDSKIIITLPAGPYMNYTDKGEPILRSYDNLRQQLVKQEINKKDCYISDEKIFYSADFENWNEAALDFIHPKYYGYYNSSTPNVIWGITVQKI